MGLLPQVRLGWFSLVQCSRNQGRIHFYPRRNECRGPKVSCTRYPQSHPPCSVFVRVCYRGPSVSDYVQTCYPESSEIRLLC